MRETLAVLRDLQELDEDLFRVRQELKRLPAERDKRRAEIDDKIQRDTELESEVLKLRMQIKEIEDGSRANRQRIAKLERESSTCSDQALLAAYGHEIKSLKREISENDEDGLRQVDKADSKEAQRKALQEEIREMEETYAELASNVEQELGVAQEKADKMETERNERMGSKVPPDVLKVYEELLEARDGMALAALEDRTCQGCYITVPTNIYVKLSRGRDLVQCPSCSRILYTYD
ncbi:MAG: zinc ribbon domain-containing protein [Planctomycetota bacterium]|jgi:predicted  nucleic acid-binding Zn-ribbon protein